MTSAAADLQRLAQPVAQPVLDEPVPMPGGIVSFFGKALRGGDWEVPSHFRVVAVIGVVRLDLRRARFTSHTTTIEAAVFAGHLEIGLPGGFRIEYAGEVIGGKFEFHRRSPHADAFESDAGAQRPLIRIIGTHVMGAIDVYENPSWDSVTDRLRRAAAAFRA